MPIQPPPIYSEQEHHALAAASKELEPHMATQRRIRQLKQL